MAFALFRLGRAGMLLARHIPALVPPAAGEPLALRLARRIGVRGDAGASLSAGLAGLGPSYVKLGQFLATRPDVIGWPAARALARLQDRVPAFPQAQAEAAVAAALGRPLHESFTSFGPAIAAASVAQVHRAATAEGADVAVKVLRPGVRHCFADDLSSFALAARAAEVLPPARRLRPRAVVAEMAAWTKLELDLRLEAAAMAEMAENIKRAEDTGFAVPAVDWSRTAADVLTTQWIDAIPMADLTTIDAAGIDRTALGLGLIRHFLRHAMRDGFFHADMHQGNLFVRPDGTIVAVDFGIMGRLGPKERRFLAEILHGFIARDYMRSARMHFEAGYVPPHQRIEDFAQALRAIGTPLMDRTAADISMARVLAQLFETTATFDMATRPELLLLQKTMVVVEGVARTLDPQLNMWSAAEPVVADWMRGELGPAARLREVAEGLETLVRTAPKLVAIAEREAAREAAPPQPAPARWRRLLAFVATLALVAIAAKLWLGD